MVRDDGWGSTQARGGSARRSAAMAAGATLGVRLVSERACRTANTPITAATRPAAIHRVAGPIPILSVDGWEAVRSLDAGSARARARNGARNAGKWKKNPGGHMNTATTRAAVSTPNHSSGGGGRRVTRDAATRVTATKPARTRAAAAIVVWLT